MNSFKHIHWQAVHALDEAGEAWKSQLNSTLHDSASLQTTQIHVNSRDV